MSNNTIEIEGLEMLPGRERKDRLGNTCSEKCSPSEANYWTLYAHLMGGGIIELGRFPRENIAEQVKAALESLCEV